MNNTAASVIAHEDHLDFSRFFSPDGREFPFTAGISLKKAGSLNPFKADGRRARKDFWKRLGFSDHRIAFLRQVHSRKVMVLDRRLHRGRRADGLVTRRQDVLLTVTAADCMPVFLYDRENGVLGLCHSGWKGTGIARIALEQMMREYGTKPGNVRALLGPAIGSCCYRVDELRAGEFTGEWGEKAAVYKDGEWYLDLRQANLALLGSLNLEEIADPGSCTSCDSRFGSFRREGPGSYTRMTAYFGYSPREKG